MTERIISAAQLRRLVEQWGYLPLFAGGIPGFSVQEMTDWSDWFSGDAAHDPWEWRELLAAEGSVAYGKFFSNRAGFISLELLPAFCNVRRDGYDFDARWDDALAPYRHKRVMDQFEAGQPVASYALRQLAGFGRDGEKGFEGVITALQMQTYLCVHSFERRRNRRGEPYGWAVGILTTPEAKFGTEKITSGYAEAPQTTRARLAEHCRALTGATAAQAARLIG